MADWVEHNNRLWFYGGGIEDEDMLNEFKKYSYRHKIISSRIKPWRMRMETLTVKAVNKAGTGILVEGSDEWFNVSKGADVDFSELNKGDKITLDANGKWVSGYEVVTAAAPGAPKKAGRPAGAVVKAPATFAGNHRDPETQDRIGRGNAVNAVLGSPYLGQTLKDMSGSEAEHIQNTKNMIEAVAHYINTGSFPEVK